MNYIKTDEHVLIVGGTGSGKSYFAESYLAKYEYVIKLDSKNEYEQRKRNGENPWRGLVEGEDFEMVEHLEDLPYCQCKKIIYCPAIGEDNEEYYNEFFKFCYERENTIIWVDELMSIASSYKIPYYMLIVATRGRSRHVTLWCCTQRPAGIPSIIPANTTHFIIYRLRNDNDRKRLYADTGCEEMLKIPEGAFTFWYFKDGMDNAIHAKLVED